MRGDRRGVDGLRQQQEVLLDRKKVGTRTTDLNQVETTTASYPEICGVFNLNPWPEDTGGKLDQLVQIGILKEAKAGKTAGQATELGLGPNWGKVYTKAAKTGAKRKEQTEEESTCLREKNLTATSWRRS